ncbi:UNVERIFIED_CONTAM: hypothetical protein K2H54_051253 [Gekko kuhli]
MLTYVGAHFLVQDKSECRFANGTRGEVRYVYWLMNDRQECLHFNSHHGLFEAILLLCQRHHFVMVGLWTLFDRHPRA